MVKNYEFFIFVIGRYDNFLRNIISFSLWLSQFVFLMLILDYTSQMVSEILICLDNRSLRHMSFLTVYNLIFKAPTFKEEIQEQKDFTLKMTCCIHE